MQSLLSKRAEKIASTLNIWASFIRLLVLYVMVGGGSFSNTCFHNTAASEKDLSVYVRVSADVLLA
jgi:hypothetical protein